MNPIERAARAGLRTASWSAETTVSVTTIVVRAAVSGKSPGAALEQLAADTRELVREALDDVVPDPAPGPAPAPGDPPPPDRGEQSAMALPQMYNALLEASTDVTRQEVSHPAYVHLLQDLSPDEARILRLFAEKGPQPALDVRTAGSFGFGSKLVAPGINMIGLYAGCNEVPRVRAYLNNLNRLGLIWFSREMIGDVNSYALLEAQPEVMEVAEELGGKSKVRTVLRSIELTPLGKNLCAQCGLLTADATTG